MRVRKKYVLLIFKSTTDAMAMEAFSRENSLPGRLIPVPQEISASCGLAWRIAFEDYSIYENCRADWEQFAEQIREYIM